ATDRVGTDPTARAVRSGARGLALRLADALAAALLIEQAVHQLDRGDSRAAAVAGLWVAERIGGSDIAEDADRQFESLVDGEPLS
ncbi:MAG: hypothetical protein WCA46_11075, partial [Actinocatenispora sp.]